MKVKLTTVLAIDVSTSLKCRFSKLSALISPVKFNIEQIKNTKRNNLYAFMEGTMVLYCCIVQFKIIQIYDKNIVLLLLGSCNEYCCGPNFGIWKCEVISKENIL